MRPAIQVLGKVEAPPWGRAQLTAPQTARVSAAGSGASPGSGDSSARDGGGARLQSDAESAARKSARAVRIQRQVA